MLDKYGVYIQAFIVIITLTYIYVLNLRIVNLKNEVDSLKVEEALTASNLGACKTSLEKSNKAVEDISVNYAKNMAKLSEWYEENPTIKYKTIEKIREVKSDECSDIKHSIDTVRAIDFDSL